MIIHFLLAFSASAFLVQGGRNCGPNPSQIYLKRGDKSSVEYWVPPPIIQEPLQSRSDDYQDDLIPVDAEASSTVGGLTTWRMSDEQDWAESTTTVGSIQLVTVSVPDGLAELPSAGAGLKVTEWSNDDVTTVLPNAAAPGVNDQLQADGAEFNDVVTESDPEGQQISDVTESSSAEKDGNRDGNVQDFTQSPEEINMELTAIQQQMLLENDIHTKTAVVLEKIMKQEEFRPLDSSTEAQKMTTQDSITIDNTEFPTSQSPLAEFQPGTTQEPSLSGVDSIQLEISRHPVTHPEAEQSISTQLQGDIQDITHILMEIPSMPESDNQIKEPEFKTKEPETVTIIDFKNELASAVDIHSEEIDQTEIRPQVVALSPVTEQPETFTEQSSHDPSDTKLIEVIVPEFKVEGSGFDPVESIDPVTESDLSSDEISTDKPLDESNPIQILPADVQTNIQEANGSDPAETILANIPSDANLIEASGSDPVEILPVMVSTAVNDQEASGSDPVEILPVNDPIPTIGQEASESDPVEILPAINPSVENDQEASGSDPVDVETPTNDQKTSDSDPVEILPVSGIKDADPVEILPSTDQEITAADKVEPLQSDLPSTGPVGIEADPVEILPSTDQEITAADKVEPLQSDLPSTGPVGIEADPVEILPVEISSTANEHDGSGADPNDNVQTSDGESEGSGSDPVKNLPIVEKAESTSEGSGVSESSIATIDRSDDPEVENEEVAKVVEEESPPEFRNDDILINRIRTIVNSLTNPRETSSILFRRTSDLIQSVFKRTKRSELSNPAEIIQSPAFQRFLRSQPLPIRRALSPNFSGRFSRQMDPDNGGSMSGEQQDDDECDLHIKTDPGLHLLLTFHNMSAPYTVDCAGAYVEIEREGNGFEARWCGNPIGQQRGVRSHVIFARSEVRVSVYNNKNTLLQYQIHSEEGNNSLDPLTQPNNDESVPTGFRADIEVIDLHDAGQYTTFQRSEAYSNVHRKIG